MPQDVTSARDSSESCVGQIRHLLLTGDILPGHKLNQAELAARLGVSRVPVREALSSLAAEGLVDYRANTGFTVTRPTIDDLTEIYLMRNLLENELLRSVMPSEVDTDLLERVNQGMADLDPIASFDAFRAANQRFHFIVFDASPLALVRREVVRLWTLSEFYRSIYIQVSGAAERVCAEHERIVAAIRAGDIDELVSVSSAHRQGTENSMSQVLGRRR